MIDKIKLFSLQEEDLDEIVAAFKEIGWNKPRNIYETYLLEQSKGTRSILIVKQDGKFCGYVTIKWESSYPAFRRQGIPEISDLNVLPIYRKQGLGSQLIAACEKIVKEHGYVHVGLGVGMTQDYGNAQRLYVKLGYIPDGQGLYYKYNPVHYGMVVTVDDDLLLWLFKSL
jgi:ribosomal protein S18 acetylase RimI-like enzyme